MARNVPEGVRDAPIVEIEATAQRFDQPLAQSGVFGHASIVGLGEHPDRVDA